MEGIERLVDYVGIEVQRPRTTRLMNVCRHKLLPVMLSRLLTHLEQLGLLATIESVVDAVRAVRSFELLLVLELPQVAALGGVQDH